MARIAQQYVHGNNRYRSGINMTQVGEKVAVIPPEGKEKCCFCGEDHQKETPEPKASFPRDMSKLKSEGRQYSIANYSVFYPGEDKPPLVAWQSDINKTGGYKAAAHHCIALKSIDQHEISGELKSAGYNPNRGSNCAWLPYSSLQFSRARAYGRSKALQKHSGGHTNAYFTKINGHIERVAELVEDLHCDQDEQVSKELLLEYMLEQERTIWRKLANPNDTDYHLYNHSYLDPAAPWGTFPSEINKEAKELINDGSILADDLSDEKINADDPENIA